MNPYKILSITDQASDQEVKRAYHAMAAKYHPDVGGDAWVFEQVRDAYDRIQKIRRPAAQANTAATASDSGSNSQNATAPPPKPSSTSAYTSQATGQRPTTAPGKATRATTTGPTTGPTTGTADPHLTVQSLAQRIVSFLFRHQLPLQSETSFFILANVLDIVFTNILLRMHAIEANPIANYVLIHWGFNGMIAFKLFLVTCVCLITQLIAVHHLRRARQTLYLGTVIVGLVLLYSGLLLVRT